ncbi:hypothetical protein FHL15_009460 [Xylaria flabelliformis]|uniref:Mitochondrial distribution and morphology protein 12 n=1 Tax=Xylaria flabelliformis TaxID=2512241 RepID=A0A553HP51_9PEZI|nr:hypothetical protein FHL15_009460 [Xylaria flabelliformis]
MSIDLNWDTLTGGPDGAALAERIRDFIHVKFQAVPLPRFIKSVTVHEFAFGTIPPSVVLKDICDPLPDFYEEDYEPDEEDDAEGNEDDEGVPDAIRAAERRRRAEQQSRDEDADGDGTGKAMGGVSGTTTPFSEGFFPPHIHIAGLRNAPGTPDIANPFLGLGMSTHGMPGGASKMQYFQSKLNPGWSGAQTPLAAVAGAQHLNGWLDATTHSQAQLSHNYRSNSSSRHSRHLSQGSISVENFPNSLAAPPHPLREKHSVSTLAATSTGASRPPTREKPVMSPLIGSTVDKGFDTATSQAYSKSKATVAIEDEDDDAQEFHQEPRVDDMQAVFRIRYAGDVRLELTAMILLDYPMPSFVGIPLKLNITGLTFDGVGVIAYIRKRVHFCFLSPEDAIAAVGEDDADDDDESGKVPPHRRAGAGQTMHEATGNGGGRGEDTSSGPRGKGKMGGLLQEIRVESEIGQREGSKQSLKNVGKVEKFVLEQVRRIFEEESPAEPAPLLFRLEQDPSRRLDYSGDPDARFHNAHRQRPTSDLLFVASADPVATRDDLQRTYRPNGPPKDATSGRRYVVDNLIHHTISPIMQINAVVGALFAVTASGSAVSSRAVTYAISGFSAFCMPHSVQCGYGFRVIPSTAAPGSNGTICGNLINGPDNLPPLPLTACFDPSFAYSVAIADGGLTLTVTSALDAHTNITGSHDATADQFIIQNGGTTMSQIYVGPSNFTIDTTEVTV